MTVQECRKTLRKRWYVVAFAALCTLVGIYAVHARSLDYQGCDALVLAPPPQPLLGNEVYLNINPSVAMVTQMVTVTMMSAPMESKLRAEGLLSDYQVTQTNSSGDIRFPSYTQPTLTICASSEQSAAVVRTVDVVTDEFRSTLYQMQARQHARPSSFIKASTLYSLAPLPAIGRPTQAYLGVLLIGIISGLALTFWFDPFLRFRNRWLARRQGSMWRLPVRDGDTAPRERINS